MDCARSMTTPPPPRLPVRDPLRDFVRRASELPLPAPEESDRLALAASRGDDAARMELVRCHHRLVLDEAIRYRGAGVRVRDLVPDGVRALEAAARAYQPRADDTFARFARARIRMAMGRRFGPN